MAISRMQEPKQLKKNGGILTLADAKRMAPPGEFLAYINEDEAKLLKSRGGAGKDINGTGIKSYFLKKVFKKAVRGVKKIAKSPIGKAALLYAGTAGLGALGAGKGLSMGMFAPSTVARNVGLSMGRMGLGSKFIGPKQPGTSFLSKLNPFGKNFDAKTAFLTGGAGLVAAPFLMDAFAPEEVEEEVEDVMDVGGIRQSARDYYQGLGGKNLAFMPQKQYVQKNFYQPNADGGRIGLMNGGDASNAQAEQMLMAEFVKYKNKGGTLSFEQFVKAVMQQQQAPEGAGMEQPEPVMMAANGGPVPDSTVPGYTTPAGYNKFDYRSGGVRVGAQEGGIMATDEASEMIDMGGMEKDFRNEGGFVAMGGKERADDVPARLSKNEFVFTADAVRNAGGGDIDKGAEVMENLMNNLEQGGEVSEDSQGLDGAQAMYDQQQMLQSRMI
jgi:hypothetical protein